MRNFTLEYRLNDEASGFPAIYHYSNLDPNEIFCRRLCDYFVKDGKVYSQTSSAKEEKMFVIYVKEESEEFAFPDARTYQKVTLEIRLLEEEKPSPLLYSYHLSSHMEVLQYLGNVYIQIGEYEYEIISTEIDEDRSTYVLYVDLTGYKYE